MKLIEAAQLNSNVKLRVSLQRMFELVTEIEINASPDRVWRAVRKRFQELFISPSGGSVSPLGHSCELITYLLVSPSGLYHHLLQ